MAANYRAKPRKNESMEKFVKRFTKNVKNLGLSKSVETESILSDNLKRNDSLGKSGDLVSRRRINNYLVQ